MRDSVVGVDAHLLEYCEAEITETKTESQAYPLALGFLGGALGKSQLESLVEGVRECATSEEDAEARIIARAASLGAALALHFAEYKRPSLLFFGLSLCLGSHAADGCPAERLEDGILLAKLDLPPEVAKMYREGKMLEMIDRAALIVQPTRMSMALPELRN